MGQRGPRPTKADAIARAALALFAERGVPGATTREIARRARTTEGNIYRYYASKDDLARKVMATCLVEFGEFLGRALAGVAGPRERLATFVRAYIAFADEYPLEHGMVVESHGRQHVADLPEDMLRPRRILIDLLTDGMDRGDFRAENPRLLAGFIAGGLARAVTVGRLRGEVESRGAFADEMVRNVLHFACRQDGP